ncbi:hypothetical protein KEM48_014076 [Puccinia striiformis f. sp. tritici PST-130]|uniref:Uncharacterized protein n=1 Tax=Puccinia striiformis f. sp. tritici PST-78 TaxID=1165861 RepID=A0A0L0UPA8_9BASI|nr:hypothetical protein KEM48_014076 [Puccinia striiformis f. sp. tritici PST-130]KNE88838.1 hypothetical protein PSTG_17720 [Puccinia striiformis f. sp. tritici PST-78]
MRKGLKAAGAGVRDRKTDKSSDDLRYDSFGSDQSKSRSPEATGPNIDKPKRHSPRNQLNLKGTGEILIASLDPAPCKGKSHYLRLSLSKVRAQHSANSGTGLRR